MGDPRLGKELEGTVDRGIADARMLGPELQVEILDAHMALGREKGLEDNVPLTRGLEPLPGDEIMK
jgi:hypothetical protein